MRAMDGPHAPAAPERATPRPGLLMCDDCGAVYRRRLLAPHEAAHCPRCGATIGRGPGLAVDTQLALVLTAAVVFAIANAAPIATLELGGVRTDATLLDDVIESWEHGGPGVALLALATAFVFPLALIALRLHVLLPLAAGRVAPGFAPAMRALHWVTRWSMVEVFLLGVLVTTVRSADVAHVSFGIGIFAWGALALLLTIEQDAGLHRIWRCAQELGAGHAGTDGPQAWGRE
jgi:paraquat-inducible protein A